MQEGVVLGMGLSHAQDLGDQSRREGGNDHFLNVVPGENNPSKSIMQVFNFRTGNWMKETDGQASKIPMLTSNPEAILKTPS